MNPAMNYELARHHMIEQQLRPWRVLDQAVVDLLYADRREDFAPAAYRALAFADAAIPLGAAADAVMLPPKLEAHIMQALDVQPHERVLEVGTGSGHMAALLAARAQEVWSVEIDPQLAESARANLARRGVGNVRVVEGDGLAGLAAHAPFDVIVVSGGVAAIPSALLAELAVGGGRLIAFVGGHPLLNLRLVTRAADGAMRTEDLIETSVPMLRHASASRFVF